MAELWRLDERITLALRELYQRFGYSRFKMSKFEAYDLYMQNKEFLVSEGCITFNDTDGTLMALKPDVTLSIVKNFRDDQILQKVCYNENVYRISGATRQYREIMQAGLECMGDVGLYEICEVVMLAAKSLQTVSDRFILELSHMDILNGVFERLNLSESKISSVIAALAEKNSDTVRQLLTSEQADAILSVMNISGPVLPALEQLDGLADVSAISELKAITEFLAAFGLPIEQIHLDFSIISDRHYYNGIVFRGYIEGIPTEILSGGQYDRLMEKMGKRSGAIGFAVYLDQLELLENRSKDYDVDTVLLYTASVSFAEIARVLAGMKDDRVLVLKDKPGQLRYKRLLQIQDGRLLEVENHG